MPNSNPRIDEFQLTGEKLLASVKKLVHEGNIRRISIRNADGVTLLEIPLVVGVAGAVLVPVWAAIGALAALLAHCTLVVERLDEGADPPPAQRTARKRVPRRPRAPKGPKRAV
jgi:hypothetical protein